MSAARIIRFEYPVDTMEIEARYRNVETRIQNTSNTFSQDVLGK